MTLGPLSLNPVLPRLIAGVRELFPGALGPPLGCPVRLGLLAKGWPQELSNELGMCSVLWLLPNPGSDRGCVSLKVDICILSSSWHALDKE